MALQYNNFQPNKVEKGRASIGGKLAVAAKRGMIVSRESGATDELELATGKAGKFLRRDVVSSADKTVWLENQRLYPDKAGFEGPVVVGGVVQAEDYDEVWVEGGDLLHASMDVSVTPGTPVTTAAGKLTVLTDSEAQETQGVVELNEAAKNGAGRRFLIKVVHAPKAVIA